MRITLESLARGELTAQEARSLIDAKIAAGTAGSAIHSALLRFVWLALSERRRDTELRSWHRLLLDTSHKLERRPEDPSAAACGGRIEGLSHLLRVSVHMAHGERREALRVRPIEAELLHHLREGGGFLSRDLLEEATGLHPAHLSRILTQLVFNGLAERDPHSSEPRYRASPQ